MTPPSSCRYTSRLALLVSHLLPPLDSSVFLRRWRLHILGLGRKCGSRGTCLDKYPWACWKNRGQLLGRSWENREEGCFLVHRPFETTAVDQPCNFCAITSTSRYAPESDSVDCRSCLKKFRLISVKIVTIVLHWVILDSQESLRNCLVKCFHITDAQTWH